MDKKKKNKISKKKIVKSVSYTRNLPVSDRKLRLIVGVIKNEKPESVIKKLELTNNKSAKILSKAVKTAIANAQNNFSAKKESLVFDEILVDKAQGFLRRDRFHGSRFNSGVIRRSRSHLKIILKGEKE